MKYFLLLILILLAMPAGAEPLSLLSASSQNGAVDFTVKSRIVILMTLLSLLPMLVMMTTCFTRFIIILSLLRLALGLQQGLPTRIVTGIALIMTMLVMRPTGLDIWNNALQPMDAGTITSEQALERAGATLSRFMLAQTSKTALEQISQLAGETGIKRPEDHHFTVKMAAFTLSELKTAFQVGFMLFIPFLVIDMVVASVLMAMGMMMLSPLVISLPLKLLLFVLVDGWALTVSTLITSVQPAL